MPVRNRKFVLITLFAALIGLALALGWPGGKQQRIGLFTTLPILWAESADVAELVKGEAPPHWGKAALARRGRIVPLDNLSRISSIDLLLIAQPRPLSPQENVALDEWVRQGGRAVIFADPMLTAESLFPLGDRRRPQDVVLLSPLLSHWGLQLSFDDTQAFGPHEVPLLGQRLPVNLPGRLSVTDPKPGCAILDGGIAARGRIGKGQVLVVGDAALLESPEAGAESQAGTVLDSLLDAVRND